MPHKFVKKSFGSALMAAFLLTSAADRADADLGDVLGTVIIGCATGAINCGKKQRRSSGVSSAQRQQNRDVQNALNTFGWNVGTADGVLGRKSRAAINQYQAYMGYPMTGQLTEFERNILLNGWQKFQAGAGNAYPRTMASVGPRVMLNIERDPNFPGQFGDAVAHGGGTWPNTQTAAVPNTNQQQVQPVFPQQQGNQVAGGTAVAPIGQLPRLQQQGEVAVSAAARCELVAQTTRIQGGAIQSANMNDSNQALSEKFCEARGFVITQGQSLATQFAVSDNELNGLCERVAAGFGPVIEGLPANAPQKVVADAKVSAGKLGLSDAATAAAYGQLCLSIGYRNDNSKMAMAGALTMIAAGQTPYGELLGHHLREGFGVQKNLAQAGPWYLSAVSALEQGANPAFVPSTTQERILVIKAAMQIEQNRANAVGVLPQVIQTGSNLPVLQPLQPINQ